MHNHRLKEGHFCAMNPDVPAGNLVIARFHQVAVESAVIGGNLKMHRLIGNFRIVFDGRQKGRPEPSIVLVPRPGAMVT